MNKNLIKNFIRKEIRKSLLTESFSNLNNEIKKIKSSSNISDVQLLKTQIFDGVLEKYQNLMHNTNAIPANLRMIHLNWGIKRIKEENKNLQFIIDFITDFLVKADYINDNGVKKSLQTFNENTPVESIIFKGLSESEIFIDNILKPFNTNLLFFGGASLVNSLSSDRLGKGFKFDWNSKESYRGKIFVVEPRSTISAQFWGNPRCFDVDNLGGNVKWCTAATKSDNLFTQYAGSRQDEKHLFYILDFRKPESDKTHKLGISIGIPYYEDQDEFDTIGLNYSTETIKIFNSEDDEIDFQTIQNDNIISNLIEIAIEYFANKHKDYHQVYINDPTADMSILGDKNLNNILRDLIKNLRNEPISEEELNNLFKSYDMYIDLKASGGIDPDVEQVVLNKYSQITKINCLYAPDTIKLFKLDLSKFTNLINIYIGDLEFSDKNTLNNIHTCQNLKILQLSRIDNINDHTINQIIPLQNLEFIGLYYSNVTINGVKMLLDKLKKIHKISIGNSPLILDSHFVEKKLSTNKAGRTIESYEFKAEIKVFLDDCIKRFKNKTYGHGQFPLSFSGCENLSRETIKAINEYAKKETKNPSFILVDNTFIRSNRSRKDIIVESKIRLIIRKIIKDIV